MKNNTDTINHLLYESKLGFVVSSLSETKVTIANWRDSFITVYTVVHNVTSNTYAVAINCRGDAGVEASSTVEMPLYAINPYIYTCVLKMALAFDYPVDAVMFLMDGQPANGFYFDFTSIDPRVNEYADILYKVAEEIMKTGEFVMKEEHLPYTDGITCIVSLLADQQNEEEEESEEHEDYED